MIARETGQAKCLTRLVSCNRASTVSPSGVSPTDRILIPPDPRSNSPKRKGLQLTTISACQTRSVSDVDWEDVTFSGARELAPARGHKATRPARLTSLPA